MTKMKIMIQQIMETKILMKIQIIMTQIKILEAILIRILEVIMTKIMIMILLQMKIMITTLLQMKIVMKHHLTLVL